MSTQSPQAPEFSVSRRTASRARTTILCHKLFCTASNATDVTALLAQILEDGGQIEDIKGSVFIEGPDSNQYLRVQLELMTSADGVAYGTPVPVVPFTVNYNAYKIGLHTDREDYGNFLRFQLKYHSSVAQVASGYVTAQITIKYIGQ